MKRQQYKVTELSQKIHARRQRVETRAFNILINKYPDEYKSAMEKVKTEYPNLAWKYQKSRALTILKQNHRSEWRRAVNEVAPEVGFQTAEMRREVAIAKAVANLEKLKASPLRTTKVE